MGEHYPNSTGWKGDPGDNPGRDAAKGFEPHRLTCEQAVVEALTVLGPSTAEQIGAKIDRHWYTVRPRLSSLKARGLVQVSGRGGRSIFGREVTVYRLSTPAEIAAFEASQQSGPRPSARGAS